MSYCKRKEYGETILNIIERNSIVPNSSCFYLCNDKRYISEQLEFLSERMFPGLSFEPLFEGTELRAKLDMGAL